MQINYSLVIFDLDGTILNTLTDLTNSLNYALSANGYPVHTLSEVRTFAGNGIKVLIEKSMPLNSVESEKEIVYNSFINRYFEHSSDETKPYNGIIPLLKTLKKKSIKTAVVSNKANFAVQKLVSFYFNGLIDFALGELPNLNRKPAPDMINYVLKQLNISVNNSIYVGDSEVDILTAKNADINCISVSWGFRDKSFLIKNGSTIVVESPKELLSYLLN